MSATLREAILERFLRYVKYDTQADPASTTIPSTAKQLVLLNVLVDELKALGLSDAFLDDKGIVMATLPANTKKANVPVIGFLAHVDTSPEMSGLNVKPIVHRAWAGGNIVFPDDPTAVLEPAKLPALAARKGDDIVTASGTTLLGADDKSGVAVIMGVLEHLLAHPEIPHGAIRVAFTPDEEIGRGVRQFDVKRFGAYCAYTLDGEGRGRMDAETFSADAMTVTFQGFNTHPGLATGVMVNSIKIASDFVNRLPKTGLAPETTGEREGFVHPMGMEASVDRTTVKFIIRDFETPGLAVKEAMLEKLARETCADWPGSSVTFEVKNSYRNMRDVLAKVPQVVENVREAMRRANVTIEESRIRGGTDGSILSEMGLPTPNLFCGMHEFHSRLEWVSAHDMEKSADVVLQLAQVWEERA
ncbi:MAG: peptidase T [Candidatus Eisenbacteria bacterium]|nr:peptidase T [Candidatus Eisenbacteria bacterium]